MKYSDDLNQLAKPIFSISIHLIEPIVGEGEGFNLSANGSEDFLRLNSFSTLSKDTTVKQNS